MNFKFNKISSNKKTIFGGLKNEKFNRFPIRKEQYPPIHAKRPRAGE
jgi:hypothetical protein